jgi:hypothetical protein
MVLEWYASTSYRIRRIKPGSQLDATGVDSAAVDVTHRPLPKKKTMRFSGGVWGVTFDSQSVNLGRLIPSLSTPSSYNPYIQYHEHNHYLNMPT